jgi:hypothetical protein
MTSPNGVEYGKEMDAGAKPASARRILSAARQVDENVWRDGSNTIVVVTT